MVKQVTFSNLVGHLLCSIKDPSLEKPSVPKDFPLCQTTAKEITNPQGTLQSPDNLEEHPSSLQGQFFHSLHTPYRLMRDSSSGSRDIYSILPSNRLPGLCSSSPPQIQQCWLFTELSLDNFFNALKHSMPDIC